MDEFNIPEGEFSYAWRSEEWMEAYHRFREVYDKDELKLARIKKHHSSGMPKNYGLYTAVRRVHHAKFKVDEIGERLNEQFPQGDLSDEAYIEKYWEECLSLIHI